MFQVTKKIDEKDEKIIREALPFTYFAMTLKFIAALDESDIQILKTYVRGNLHALRDAV